MNTVDALKDLYKTLCGKDYAGDPNPTDAEMISAIAKDAQSGGEGGSGSGSGVGEEPDITIEYTLTTDTSGLFPRSVISDFSIDKTYEELGEYMYHTESPVILKSVEHTEEGTEETLYYGSIARYISGSDENRIFVTAPMWRDIVYGDEETTLSLVSLKFLFIHDSSTGAVTMEELPGESEYYIPQS